MFDYLSSISFSRCEKLSFLDLWLRAHIFFLFPLPCLFQFFLCLCQRRRIFWIISLCFSFFLTQAWCHPHRSSCVDVFHSCPCEEKNELRAAALHTSIVFQPVNKRSHCHIWAEKCARACVLRHMTASWVFLDWSKRQEGCTSSLTLFERHFSSWLTSTVVPPTAKRHG